MAKLPNFRRIFKTDFDSDYQDLVEKLGDSINYNFEKIYDALNGKLNTDNLSEQIKDLDLIVGSDGIPTTRIGFTSSLTPARPIGSQVIQAQNLTNPTSYPTTGIFLTYSENTGTIFIEHITGLIPNNRYKLKAKFFSS
jgi:hypothetical protein